jgi:hypothetical protein
VSATYPVRRAAVPARKAAAKPKSRPRLVVISSHRQVVARGPFIAIVGALMLAGLLSLLMLHTLAAQDAFRQTTLQHRLNTLTDAEQQLEQQVQTDSAPAALQARATALGMVPSAITSYRRHANGRTYAKEVPLNQVPTSTVAATSTKPTTTTSSTTSDTSTKPDSTTTAGAATTKKHHKATKSSTASTSSSTSGQPAGTPTP